MRTIVLFCFFYLITSSIFCQNPSINDCHINLETDSLGNKLVGLYEKIELSIDLSAQFTGNVSIAGGLTVTGTTTSVNTTNTAVADQLLVINDGEAQNGVDNGSGESGLEVDRGTDGGGSPNDHAFFVFNE
ncbi:MAG: hypothetical protein HOM80_11620, partial [Bacteroidetes bacterium]|nr:hypothetical protein [Bacteroidota bacterium]